MDSSTGLILYYDFTYDGEHDSSFDYDVPFEIFCDAARKFFNDADAPIDGTDTSVWNVLVSLNAIDKVFEQMEEWLKEKCHDDAYDEYKNSVDEEHEWERDLDED